MIITGDIYQRIDIIRFIIYGWVGVLFDLLTFWVKGHANRSIGLEQAQL